MKILYIVCPNGFGHVKRSVIISEELIKLNSKISIHWYLSKYSNEFLASNASVELLKNSSFNIFNNNQSISLANLKHFLFAERFKIWSQNLELLIKQNNYDLLISDNLSSPLLYHENCLMVGSFLWYDVIKSEKNNELVLNQEKNIFRELKPTIYSMKDFVMPEIKRYGNAIEVPSLIDKYIIKNKTGPIEKRTSILVTAGKSKQQIDLLKKLKNNLYDEKLFNIYSDKLLVEDSNENSSFIFDYSEKSFTQLKIIICRPGIGIITDAIRYDIPLIVNGYYSNLEMEHNSKIIEKLGIGIRIDFEDYQKFKNSLIKLFNDSNRLNKIIDNLKSMKTGGSRFIANHIVSLK